MSDNNKTLSDIIRSSLDEISSSLGADTVIGTPITTEVGTTIIPVSKVSVGIVTGGMDINNNSQKLGGGAGSGISVSPIGFLVVKADGSVEMLSVSNPVPSGSSERDTVGQIADLVERSPEIIEKIKGIFSKKKDKDEEKAE
ncbi:MAG: sporulation protein YtfJ [Clostridia bacterium]|nr:sporulation protein YtfJ [Clostridia bacterium]